MGNKVTTMNERRRLLQALGLDVAAACGAFGRTANVLAADAGNKSFAVTTVNHLSYASPNYQVTRDFYVDLFGMRDVWDDGTKCQLDCGPDDAPNSFYITGGKPGTEPTAGHFSFGLPDFWSRSNELRDELLRRKFPGVH